MHSANMSGFISRALIYRLRRSRREQRSGIVLSVVLRWILVRRVRFLPEARRSRRFLETETMFFLDGRFGGFK
jgi:hypothetical protein